MREHVTAAPTAPKLGTQTGYNMTDAAIATRWHALDLPGLPTPTKYDPITAKAEKQTGAGTKHISRSGTSPEIQRNQGATSTM